ncbi:MAG: bifunctional precorrin-2 dehydrogenase/sirohydrochlorin ferrochelatase [Balneolaceae bacterium]
MKVYPVYLNRLDQKKTVIIGGNHEAERKVNELLECDALLTVISPDVTDHLKELADSNRFDWIRREYVEGDLEGAFMVIVADFKGDINRKVFEEAEERGILANVMDDIPHCNFTFGSLVKRGPLTLSISTSGAAPTLAVRLRQRFEKEFGPEYEPFLEMMQQLRDPMKDVYDDFDTRKELWYSVVDSDVLQLFRENRTKEAYNKTRNIVGAEVFNRAFKKDNSSILNKLNAMVKNVKQTVQKKFSRFQSP